MPILSKKTEVSDQEIVDLLRAHIAGLPPAPAPEFSPGDAVRLDTGWIGVVHTVDALEGEISVYYVNGNGDISGPAIGYRLERLTDS